MHSLEPSSECFPPRLSSTTRESDTYPSIPDWSRVQSWPCFRFSHLRWTQDDNHPSLSLHRGYDFSKNLVFLNKPTSSFRSICHSFRCLSYDALTGIAQPLLKFGPRVCMKGWKNCCLRIFIEFRRDDEGQIRWRSWSAWSFECCAVSLLHPWAIRHANNSWSRICKAAK